MSPAPLWLAVTTNCCRMPDVSQFGAWGARRTVDGMRFNLAKQFDILNYTIPARFDIIYGYKTRYPEIACRVHADG